MSHWFWDDWYNWYNWNNWSNATLGLTVPAATTIDDTVPFDPTTSASPSWGNVGGTIDITSVTFEVLAADTGDELYFDFTGTTLQLTGNQVFAGEVLIATVSGGQDGVPLVITPETSNSTIAGSNQGSIITWLGQLASSVRYASDEAEVSESRSIRITTARSNGTSDVQTAVVNAEAGASAPDVVLDSAFVDPAGDAATVGPASGTDNAQVAALEDGTYVIVWRAGTQISAQRMTAEGDALGAVVNVNVAAANTYVPSVAALADGGYVVSWFAYNSTTGSYDLTARSFTAEGASAGDKVVTSNAGYVDNDVIGLEGGGYAVLWSANNSTDGSLDSFVRFYAADGTAAAAIPVHSTTAGYEHNFQGAALAGGGAVAIWIDGYGSNYLYGRIFDADGAPSGAQFQISNVALSNVNAVVGLADGTFVVSWAYADGSGTGVWQRHFDGTGAPLGEAELVNQTVNNAQTNPNLVALADGGWLVTWQSQQSGNYDVYGQRYDASGSAIGGEFALAAGTGNQLFDAYNSTVALLADGNVAVVWRNVSAITTQVFDIEPASLSGDEDTAMALPLSIGWADLDGSETLVITLTGFPEGTTFNQGSLQEDGSWRIEIADPDAPLELTPPPHWHGQFSLALHAETSEAVNGDTAEHALTIEVTVNSVVDQPAAQDDVLVANEDAAVTYDASDLLGNDEHGDDLALTIVSVENPTEGSVVLNGDGSVTFTPDADFNGNASFDYTIEDTDGVTAIATATIEVAAVNDAPVLDLDADGVGTGFASAYTEGGAAAAISDTDVSITDADVGDDILSATITITNPETGDKLNVGTLPGTVSVDPISSDTVVVLLATAGTSAADFEAAIEAITYSSTSDNPTDGGTNTARTITVVVNDGSSNSNTATATVTVADDNADAPAGTSATITAFEDTFRLIEAADLGFSDVDGTFASVTISAVSGGAIYFDADGTAGAGAPVLATLPQTYTAQDLIDGKVSFRAGTDANGSGLGTITFAVTDDDGNTDAGANTLTLDVTAVNDSPVLTTGGPIAATEQTAVAILPAGSVADVDLDARNGGNGDYAGASFSVNRNPATNQTEDVFSLVAGPNFTVNGSSLEAGGLIFGTISVDGSAGLIVINFTSLETTATSALVDEVIQAVRYTNTSDNPPTSVDLAVGFDDGSPGGGQGAGATDLDVNLVTVNIAGVNDAPVNSLGGTIGTGEDAIDAWLSGMSISDPDVDAANDDIVVTFHVDNGILDIRTDVVGGIVGADITGGADDSDTITVTATLNQINATLAASNGLTYSPDANFNGDDTLTVISNDQGSNGSDSGLTGDGTSEEDIDTRTISVSAVNDPPVAQPDAVDTEEDDVLTGAAGALFGNNGSGVDADADADGDTLTISHVNGSTTDVGNQITLASGALLTVNADGSYSYDPNGQFVTLTDNSSGAVNTSATDSFTYTLDGGNTVTVTVTVNGVAGAGDWLRGDGTDNTISGTPQGDLFMLQDGGDDDVDGLAGDDGFYFGGVMIAAANVDGGDGELDQVGLQGDYSAGLTFGANSFVNVEMLVLLAGNDTRFGDPGTNLYDYDLTTVDANVAAGQLFVVSFNQLLAGEDVTFDGSAETDGAFLTYGGLGTDDLTGGAGDDGFYFGSGRFGASDVVDGGVGTMDQLGLQGDYTITFGAGQLTGIEMIVCLSAYDARFHGNAAEHYTYDLTTDEANVANGDVLVVSANQLIAGENLTFDGSAETDGGRYIVYGGDGNDTIAGGAGNDELWGRSGADTLTGGGGNDSFVYGSAAHSVTGAEDEITDFTLGDLIGLSGMDAIEGGADDAFSFIGASAFSNTAGELRAQLQSGADWLVEADTDGDGTADFALLVTVTGGHTIVAGDFML